MSDPAEYKVLVHRNQLREEMLLGRKRFDYPVKETGKTTHFTVYAAAVLGANGQTVAQAVLAKCEKDYQTLAQYFGMQIKTFNVIAAPLSPNLDGTGGAYHHSCDAVDLYCDVVFHPEIDAAVTSALVIAEETEVFMGVQAKGWDCGASNGEGLSRVLAEEMYPGVLDGYESASDWLDGGRPDWVTQIKATDQDMVANGCSVLFLNWLHYQLGLGWDKICQAAAPTLEGTYEKLTGKKNAFPEFKALLDKHFPPGQPAKLKKDNPFPLA